MLEIFDNDNTQLIQNFELYLKNRGMSKSYTKLCASTLMGFMKRGYDLRNDRHYLEYLRERTVENRSFYVYDVMLKFVKYTFSEDKDLKNNLIKTISEFKKRYKDPIRQSLELPVDIQLSIIKKFESKRLALIAWIQKETGVRAGDVLRLKKDRIKYEMYKDEDGNVDLIMSISFIKKGEKVSVIPIYNMALADHIEKRIHVLPPNEDYVFMDRSLVHKKNRNDDYILMRRNYNYYHLKLREICISLGIDSSKFSTHDWRRNFAHRVWVDVLGQKDVYSLQKLMGHASIDTTVRYLRSSGTEHKGLFKKFSSLDN